MAQESGATCSARTGTEPTVPTESDPEGFSQTGLGSGASSERELFQEEHYYMVSQKRK